MSLNLWTITDGWFALALRDSGASGYKDSDQTPGGKAVNAVKLVDYSADAATNGMDNWKCQATDIHLTANPSTDTTSVPATFCQPAQDVPTPAATGFTIEGTMLQDANTDTDLIESWQAFVFANDTKDVYAAVGFNASGRPPVIVGVGTVQAMTVGGPARDQLTADFSIPLLRKPDIWFGSSTPGRVILGSGAAFALPVVAITAVTAGSPGTFAPANATVPASLAALKANAVVGTSGSAKPSTAWTTGQSVKLADNSEAHWTGTDWAAGKAS